MRTGSCSHFRKRSTAVALGSPTSSGPVGRCSARVTPLSASSPRASASVNGPSRASVMKSTKPPQRAVSKGCWPAVTTTTVAGSVPWRSVVITSCSQASRNGPVRSYVSKNRTTQGAADAASDSSVSSAGVSTRSGDSTSCTSSWLRKRELSPARRRSAPCASWAASSAPAKAPTPGTMPSPTRPARITAVLPADGACGSGSRAATAASASCRRSRWAASSRSSSLNLCPCAAN